MTNDTKAPERISTRHYANGIINASDSAKGFRLLPSNHVTEHEYIRHDLHVDLVAAAYGDVSAWLEKLYAASLDGDEATMIVGQALLSAADLTRALTPEDAQAALDRMLKEEREKALREAAYVALNACLVPPDGGAPSQEEADVCEEAYRRICALIDQMKGATP